MKAAAAVLAMLLAGLQTAGVPALANDVGIRVTRAGPAQISAEPGSVNTVAFRLITTTPASARVTLAAMLPAGWQLINGAGAIDLAPDGAALQLVSFSIPRNTPAGHYTVRYSAAYGPTGRQVTSDSVSVEVRSRPAVDVQFMAAPALVRGGSQFTVSFALRNQGNTTATLALQARADHGLGARPDFTTVRIEPDHSFQLTVRVTTPPRIANEIHTRITLLAADEAQGVAINASTAVVRVLPTANTRTTGVGQLPLRLATRLNSSEQTAPSVELAGSGPLIAGTDLGIDVLARTSTRSNGLTEDRDQLYVHVGNRNFDARLGDHYVTLTPLTERGRPGFGGSVSMNAGALMMGVVAAHDRRGNGPSIFGSTVGLRLGSLATLSGNYMTKSRSDEDRLLSVRSTITPSRFANAEIEYAANAAGSAGQARIVRLGGDLRWASYDLRSMRNSPAFRGSSAGISTDAAVLRVRPGGRFEVGGAFTRSERAALVSVPAPSVETYRLFTTVGALIGVEAEERNWVRSTGELSSQMRTIRARSNVRTGPIRWRPGVEYSEIANRLTGASTAGMKYTLRTELAAGQQRLAIGLGQATSDEAANGWRSHALTAALQPLRNTYVDVDLQEDSYANSWRTTLLNAAIVQRILGEHQIAVRARLIAFNRTFVREQSVVTVEYVLPLNVNVPRSQTARVDGIVIDAQTNRPVRDAVVRLSDRTVMTGPNGRFSFRDLEPSTHYLQVELSASGRNLTALIPNPLVLDLHDQSVRQIRITVTEAAAVRGTIRLRARDAGDSEQLAGLVRNAIVELSQGSESQRRAVSATGAFSFEGLRPGTWRLRLVNELPVDYTVAGNAHTSIALAQGEEREVVLEVLRKDRPLKVLDERQLPVLEQPTR